MALVGALQRADVGRRVGPQVAVALLEGQRRVRQHDQVAGGARPVPRTQRVAVGSVRADPVALDARRVDVRRRWRGWRRRRTGPSQEQSLDDRVLAGHVVGRDADEATGRDVDREVQPGPGVVRAGEGDRLGRRAVGHRHVLAARCGIPVEDVEVERARVRRAEIEAQPELAIAGTRSPDRRWLWSGLSSARMSVVGLAHR